MGMHESRSNITKLVRELQSRWDDLRPIWADANSRAFEERFIQPMVDDSRNAVQAIDYMARIIAEIKRDCG